MAKKSKLTSGRSSGAAGTRPPAKTEGYAAVKAGFSSDKNTPRSRVKNISGKSGNIDRKMPVNKANTPDRIASRMAAMTAKK